LKTSETCLVTSDTFPQLVMLLHIRLSRICFGAEWHFRSLFQAAILCDKSPVIIDELLADSSNPLLAELILWFRITTYSTAVPRLMICMANSWPGAALLSIRKDEIAWLIPGFILLQSRFTEHFRRFGTFIAITAVKNFLRIGPYLESATATLRTGRSTPTMAKVSQRPYGEA
jgi:hypothetical protein